MPWLFGAVPLVIFHSSRGVFWHTAQCSWGCPAPQGRARTQLWGLPASLGCAAEPGQPPGKCSPEQFPLGSKAHQAHSVCPGEVEAQSPLPSCFHSWSQAPSGFLFTTMVRTHGWQISPWQKGSGFHSFLTPSLLQQQSAILHFHCQP